MSKLDSYSSRSHLFWNCPTVQLHNSGFVYGWHCISWPINMMLYSFFLIQSFYLTPISISFMLFMLSVLQRSWWETCHVVSFSIFKIFWNVNVGHTDDIVYQIILSLFNNTVKPAHLVTSIKKSPVLKDHLFLALSYKIS
jgi:hypothetical protein